MEHLHSSDLSTLNLYTHLTYSTKQLVQVNTMTEKKCDLKQILEKKKIIIIKNLKKKANLTELDKIIKCTTLGLCVVQQHTAN